jgi:hypothetical protein
MNNTHELLRDIGVSPHLVGYTYLCDAIERAATDPEITRAMTKGLYSAVATAHNTTASRVERGMRHAIKEVFSRRGQEITEKYFGNTIDPQKGKPTNGEFVVVMAQYYNQDSRAEHDNILPPAPLPDAFTCSDCGEQIINVKVGEKRYTAQEIAENTTATHGRPLCWACGKAATTAKAN